MQTAPAGPFSLRARAPAAAFSLLVLAGSAVHYAGLDPTAQGALYLALAWTAVGGVALGARLHRLPPLPWGLIAGGLALLAAGDTVWTASVWNGVAVPFPSAADVAYVAGYPALLAGVVSLAAQGRREAAGGVLDALVVGAGAGLLLWAAALDPAGRLSAADPATGILAAFYPTADLVLLAALVDLAAHRSLRLLPSLAALAAAVCLLLATDAVYGFQALRGTYRDGSWLGALWLGAYASLALAALHPSSRRLSGCGLRAPAITTRRLALLAGASLATVGAFVLQGARGEAYLPVFAAFGGALVSLVFGRMALLFRSQRQALEELDRSRRLYRTLVEASRELVTLISPDGRYLYASPAHERLRGYRPDELLGRSGLDHLHPDEAAAGWRLLEKLRSSPPGTSLAFPGRLRRKDGGYLQLETTATLVETEEGPAILAVSRDVTGQRRAERELAEALETLRTLIDSSPVAISAIDETGRITLWNPAAERLFGWRAEEVVGRPSPLFPDERARRRITTALLRGEGVEEEEVVRLRRDGTPVEVAFRAAPVRDVKGRIRGAIGLHVDISARKRAERALLERERLLQAIVESEPECVKLIDRQGRITMMNRSGLAMLEVDSQDEVLGRLWRDLVEPDSREAVEAAIRAGLAGHQTKVELECVSARGARRRLEATVAPLRSEEGEVKALVSVSRDVTEQRRLERELREAQRLEAVSTLAGGVAHDFNNLLTVIDGFARLALERAGEEDPVLRSQLSQIVHAGERAAALTRQLLAFARRQVLQPEALDLNAVVEEAAGLLRSLAGERIELSLRLDPALGPVRADRTQVEQVLVNLVANARDAMPEGGLLAIETVDDPAGGWALLRVSDTGCGMDEGARERIFEPFFTTKPDGLGSGLGLATVHGIVAQSGGSVEVESEPGAGSVFTVRLPRAAGSAPPPGRPQGAEDGHADGAGAATILLVEDEEVVRRLVREVLEGHGYTVVEAGDAGEALALVDRGQAFDLLLTDVVMPGMTGPELVARARERRPGTRALLISGYPDGRLEEAGAGYLQKPFRADELAAAVQAAMGRSERAGG